MAVNPVFINELRQSAFRRRTGLVASAWIGAALFCSWMAQFGIAQSPIVYAPLILLPLLVPAIAAGAFAKEYEQQTWLDLYLTRLTNAQVVLGKFFAYFVQVIAALLAFVPSMLFLLLNEYSRHLSELTAATMPIEWQFAAFWTTCVMTVKLFLSAALYILLAMVCSRYSPNRRTALIWSYVALGLYTALGFFVWQLVGSLDYRIQVSGTSGGSNFTPVELAVPGFMESFHLIFCAVCGIGAVVLLWISLSEQRGYRSGDREDSVTRAWQPIAHRQRR